MRLTTLILIATAGVTAGARTPSGDTLRRHGPADRGWFERTTQTLYDAVAVGNKAPWEQVLATDCVFTTEDGVVQTRSQVLSSLTGLAPGFSGRIKVVNLTVRPLGTGAVVHYWLDEWEDALGDTLRTKYVVTDSYRRAGDGWKLVASQTTVVPRDLEPVPVDARHWPALVGEYHLGSRSGPAYHVFLRNGALYGGSRERSATRLIPLAPLVFFQQGSIHTIIFVADSAGRVDELREIHKFNEVIWKRVGR